VITVFGSINLDVSTRIAHLPKPGETVIGDAYLLSPGGKGANQAVAARRAGARVRMVGAVGRDAFADPALELLREAEVDVGHVRRSTIGPTGLATIAVDAAGENQIVVATGANAEASADDLGPDTLDSWTLLLMQLELRPSEVARAVAMAKAAGARVVLNLAPAVPLAESAIDAVDVLVVNEVEAQGLARQFALPALKLRGLAGALCERRNGPVVLTAGAAGAYVATSRYGVVHVAAPPVTVIDTTGAGDAFVGALAASLDRGVNLTDATRHGVAAGALACRTIGAQSAMPFAADIDALAGTLTTD